MKILVVAAHPDDESLGCGGTILKHIQNGDTVAWLIITNMKEEYGYSASQTVTRNTEISQVAEMYNFSRVYNLNIKPASLNSENQLELIESVSKVFNDFKPETIYLVNRSDAHSDHRYTFQAVMACTKPFRYSFVKKILMYECISETEMSAALPENVFIPNYFIDVSDTLEEKLNILKIYKSEMGEHPFPRSLTNVKALATFRGATAGVKYAEAFMLVRCIDK